VVNKHPDTRKERTWYELCDIDVHISVVVVEAPITFGHSQLLLKTKKNIEEDVRFEMVAVAIKKCLPIIKTCIPVAIEKAVWADLRKYTNTEGKYIKTLILRSSADEKDEHEQYLYKVHLVPYFDSHLKSTIRLFNEDGDGQEGKAGGLLRWLGEAEKSG
jgi:hypothetical protein